jgi:REP element-mobilizing transposase RayT
MYLTPFTSLKWAYQLHYYLCFQTHRRKEPFRDNEHTLKSVIEEVCASHEYHLLESKAFPAQLRSLVSLRPDQAVAKTVQVVKSKTSREWSQMFGTTPPLWARGYLAQSVGEVRIDTVRNYLEQQPNHHGYASRVLPPVFQYRAESQIELTAAHSFFDLSHHLVFATSRRHGVFDSHVGQGLVEYWLRVAAKHNFALDQISVVPDHIHSIVRIVPSMSIENCALLLMNNGQHFLGKQYPQLLVQSGLNQLWQPSAYAGTCGDYSTGLLQKWLSNAG